MTTNVIPMAGLGSRFDGLGYRLPKPLIPVSGEPMIVQAIRNMPSADKWIFIVRKEHVEQFGIDKVLKKEKPNCQIIAIDYTTEGQACTVLLAEPYMDRNQPIYIFSCDNTFVYDKKKFAELAKRPDVDSITWTMTQQEIMTRKPEAHGWCVLQSDGIKIEKMSVKVPISDKPFLDHAVVGAFWFKRAGDFIDSTKLMIKQNIRAPNGEFYVDACPDFMKQLGKSTAIFDIDLVVSWGTPQDLFYYDYMQHCIKNGIEPKGTTDSETSLRHWRTYFWSGKAQPK